MKTHATSKRFPWRLVVYGLLFAIYLSILIPNLLPTRAIASKNACLANLEQIDKATTAWALTEKKSLTDRVDGREVAKYLKSGQLPTCPAGGNYELHLVKDKPTCSLAHALGHSLK